MGLENGLRSWRLIRSSAQVPHQERQSGTHDKRGLVHALLAEQHRGRWNDVTPSAFDSERRCVSRGGG